MDLGRDRHPDKYYYNIVFLYVDDTVIGSYNLSGVLAKFSRRFDMTTGANGSTFLGLNVWQDPSTFEITISFKDYLEENLLRLASLPSFEVTLPKVVGILLLSLIHI